MAERYAIVTGASSGIGYELAAICARDGFDLLIAADSPEIHRSAETFRNMGTTVAPAGVLAEQHRKMAEPGSASKVRR